MFLIRRLSPVIYLVIVAKGCLFVKASLACRVREITPSYLSVSSLSWSFILFFYLCKSRPQLFFLFHCQYSFISHSHTVQHWVFWVLTHSFCYCFLKTLLPIKKIAWVLKKETNLLEKIAEQMCRWYVRKYCQKL